MDLIRKYIARFGQQLQPFIRKPYQTLIILKFHLKMKNDLLKLMENLQFDPIVE
jgi:hypothetical protein